MSDPYFEQPDRRTHQPMNPALRGALGRSGFRVKQLGMGGAWLVAGQGNQKTGAGR